MPHTPANPTPALPPPSRSTAPRHICVYCASSNAVGQVYHDTATELGRRLAAEGDALVYGAANCGLMGRVARAALDGGATVYGVVPENIHAMGVTEFGCTTLVVTVDIRDRKARMAERADAFVVLPGGLGTLDEFFETLSMKLLGDHADKPLILVNTGDFFAPLIALLESLYAEGFAPDRSRVLYTVVANVDDAYATLDAALPR